MPRLIVVLGMHRSGTSAITRCLPALGVTLGDDLIPPVDGNNDKGFWEDRLIVFFNNEMLDAGGLSWCHLHTLTDGEVRQLDQQGYVDRAVELLRARVAAYGVFGLWTLGWRA